MIYLDSSVALAHILSQQRRPPSVFWRQPMMSSRLLQHEVWNRLNAYGVNAYRQGKTRILLKRLGFHEMSKDVLARSLRPFPLSVRTLDGLHLATMDYLREQGIQTTLASYDGRLLAAAREMGFAKSSPKRPFSLAAVRNPALAGLE